MRCQSVICLTLLVALVSGSPFTVERPADDSEQNSKPISVVDVPAGYENKDDTLAKVPTAEEVQNPESKPTEDEGSLKVDQAPKETDIPAVKTKPSGDSSLGTSEDEYEGPTFFGFKFPPVVIIRRPTAFSDPFAGFQSPFFSRRPLFPGFDSEEKGTEPATVDAAVEDKKQNGSETIKLDDVMKRVQLQMNNLFNNLFNPNNFNLPRPSFSRPTFSRPSFFAPFFPSDESTDAEEKVKEAAEEGIDEVDFDKLPANYKNTTSETKIVDGKKVTINKTVQKISNNNSNGFFHISIVKVSPEEESISAEEKEPEPVVVGVGNPEPADLEINSVTTVKSADMDPKLNEVDRVDEFEKDKEIHLAKDVLQENKYEVDNGKESLGGDSQNQATEEQEIRIIPIKSGKLIKGNGVNRGADLSSDIRVNNMMEEDAMSGKLRSLYDPDEVEVFDLV